MSVRYWVESGVSFHGGSGFAVFEQFHAPAAVVVPHVSHHLVGVFGGAAGRIGAQLVGGGVACALVLPAHTLAIDGEHPVAARCAVHTFLGAPPGAAHCCRDVLVEVAVELQIHIEVGVAAYDVRVEVLEHIVELAHVGKPVVVERGVVEVGAFSRGDVHEHKHRRALRQQVEVLLEPSQSAFGDIAYIVDAESGVEIVVDEYVVGFAAIKRVVCRTKEAAEGAI